jgi:hypothetical protein
MDILGRTEFDNVVVEIGGRRLTVPNDPENGHYRMVMSAVDEDFSSISLLPPPALSSEEQRKVDFPNLEPDQFWFVLRVSGFEPDLKAWVAAMNDPESQTYDPVSWASASSKLEFAKFFERDHPFVEEARQAMGMAEAELDALWAFGAGPRTQSNQPT